jgi:chorismate mutase/prephenate dehydratase
VDLPALTPLRSEIDSIDREILDLLRRRLEVVYRVGEVKRAVGAQIHDPERESRILERLGATASAPLSPEIARTVFKCIIETFRAEEERHVRE